MTEKYYMKVLEALGEKISDQEQTIFFQKHQIERLETKLAEAEAQLKEKVERIIDKAAVKANESNGTDHRRES